MKTLLASPHMSEEGYEKEYVKYAFDTNWIAPLGENVTQFENAVANFYDGQIYPVALSSGTGAIHLALKSIGVEKGDIVFCQSLTFSGSANPISYVGATPVFIDSEECSGNMSPVALKKAYEKYPNPKAIIIVDLYGVPANFDELLPIAKLHNTPVIEDSAEAFGSSYKGKKCGLFGNVGILSFNGNKIITTSGGGMLLAHSKEIQEKVVFWSTQSREKCVWYEHKEIGYNYRLSNVLAGIGRGQMKVLDKRIEKKRAINSIYRRVFADCKHIKPFGYQDGSEPNRWLSVIKLIDTSITPMDVVNMLKKSDIDSRPAWKPMHLQPVFKDCDFFSTKEEGSVSGEIFDTCVCIPSDTKTSLEEIRQIAELIRNFVENNK